MADVYNHKSSFTHMLADSFSSYAEKHPLYTAKILEKIIYPESENTEEEAAQFNLRLKKVVILLTVLPEAAAAKILADFRCLSNEENTDFFDQFIFEMARTEEFDPYLFTDALADFTIIEAAEPYYGIDKARIVGEAAFGTKRILDSVNRLTEMLTETPESEESDTH